MPARLVITMMLACSVIGPLHAQATADGANGRTDTGATLSSATLSSAAVRPLPDPSQPCRHGADGLPGQGGCRGGEDQPALPGSADPPPFTGGVFGPGGRGPDTRADEHGNEHGGGLA